MSTTTSVDPVRVTAPPVTAPPTKSAPVRRRPSLFSKHTNIPGGLGGALWLIIVVIPLYWVLTTSFRSSTTFFSDAPLSLPSEPTLANYVKVFDSGFFGYFTNSVIVTIAAVIIAVFVSLLAAYTIARNTHVVSRTAFSLVLLGLAVPLQAAIIPIFYMLSQMGLYDTLLALIIPSAAFAIPITVVILVNFLRDIPGELFESMRLDGATDWTMLWKLVLPLSRPALITVGIYNALGVWNGFLFPLVLTQSPSVRVLPLALWSFQSELTVDVPGIMAAVVMSMIPILTLYIFGRRQLVAGLTAGFGK
ncbi:MULTISPECIES: carbohydrate ABC transporter permease [unclassified Salinibacterium]|uniref:carbohydrate ABC transporter permease n=1 Tax=unclassified Salinibacterium TaxID=2632331 RepID=UPI0018CE2C0D|nr:MULTISPECIES: carbohydrate ABC transporter permease [unclassified Salinibacterium]MBH0022962.1 carbohydrate ABC transporter permease [Salinibacterium sp. SWN248]MBH0052982.1 carbohydrate ABC transporter permease [Salinibacterium sp. SWN139]MBH0082251.1 carbohydrate ABC transporter permease [Salinibacterium sp. SWN167]